MNTLRKTNNIIDYIRVKDFLDKYPDLYSEYEKKVILNNVLKCRSNYNYNSDYMREIYDELGLIPDSKNIYIGFLNFIKDSIEIENRNILEVGGGTLPRLSKRIVNTTNNTKITIYDPRLSIYINDTDRMKLVRKEFKKNTQIDGIDLLLGFMPCKGAEELIDSAILNKKDFLVGLCEGGPHGDYFDFYESDEEWLDCMLTVAKSGVENNNMGKLKIKYLKKFDYKYPIIYNEK